MKALLYKQFKLVAHPMTLFFVLSSAMLLIPNYPYTVSFFYVTLGLFFMFQNAREQHDNDFSALLPIRKKDTVKSAVAFVVIIETASLVLASGFAVLSNIIAPGKNNLAGVDANPAVIALGFIVFAIFNGIFLTSFYRTGYKVGTSFLKANIFVFIVVAVDVIIPHILPWTDGYDVKQYFLLAICLVIYSAVTFFSYKRSAYLYEMVDL